VFASLANHLWPQTSCKSIWRELNKALLDMLYKQSPAVQCLHYGSTMSGLIVWLTWIDDCLIAVDAKGVAAAKERMKQRFECDDVELLTDYVGCKVERNEDSIKFTQPVLLRSSVDEFVCKKGDTNDTCRTRASVNAM